MAQDEHVIDESNQTNILDNYELVNLEYTKGIQITQCTLSGSHFSIWEFSGYEPYKNFYDPLINTCHVFVILYKIDQSEDECFTECIRWLEYLRSRVTNTQPYENSISMSMTSLDTNTTSASSMCEEGLSSLPKVVFIGTHSDHEANGVHKATNLKTRIDAYYSGDEFFDLSERHFVLDARSAWDSEIKLLNQKLVTLKQTIVDFLPKCTILLNRTLNRIQEWRKMITPEQITPPTTPIQNKSFSFVSTNSYPVITWKHFVENIREFINPLANDDHLNKIRYQLELMGEIVSIKKNDIELVCYQPEWAFKVLGRMLSHKMFYESINLNGVLRLNNLNDIYHDMCSNLSLIKDLLVSFDLCTEFEDVCNGDLLYEFSCLNFLSEPLPLSFQSIKTYPNKSQFVFNGFRVSQSLFHLNSATLNTKCSMTGSMSGSMTESMMAMFTIPVRVGQLASIFFRLQVFLRHVTSSFDESRKHRVETPSRAQKPLVRACSKLDTLLDSGESSSSAPTTASSTMNIIKLNKNFRPSINGTLIDLELNQTRYCSRVNKKSCFIEALISLDHVNGEFIELRACAPHTHKEELFFFVQDLYSIIEQVVFDTCPNISLQKSYMQFRPMNVPNNTSAPGVVNCEVVYSNKELVLMQIENRNKFESIFLDLVCCGSENIRRNLSLGTESTVNKMAGYTKKTLCKMLDKADPLGRDWSILAFLLGLQDHLRILDGEVTPGNTVDTPTNSLSSNGALKLSKCEFVINEWARQKPEQANVKTLLSKIKDLGRLDVFEMLLNTLNLFHIHLFRDSGIQNSNQTLASIK